GELTGKLAEGGEVDKLADLVTEWTAGQMGAAGAVLWIVDGDELRLAACYGVDRASVEAAGGAKAEKVRKAGKIRRFDNIDEGRVLRTAMIDVQPRTLLLLPVRGRTSIVAVLELAGEHVEDVDLLGDALERIGLALETSIATSKIKELSTALAAANDELRAQNEELRAQEEELRSQSDELVTKQKDLAVSNAALEKGSRHKSEFLSDMSHELRTPLNAVIGFSELLLGDTYGELAETQRERVNDIATAGRQLLTLVNDILDLSRIEAGRVELKIADIDLRSSMDDAVALLQPVADKKKVKIEAMLPPKPLMVSADPDRVRQIMVNLLSNAIKFTPASGDVVVAANEDARAARIEVRDTGIGISPDDARKLFSPFTQLESGVNAGGAGLGLSISKRLVELMSGEIGVDSAVGRGSIFYFTLPRAGEKGKALEPTNAQSREPKKWASKRRVLVVEDDPKHLHAIEELLARAGHDVHTATGPASAMTDVEQFGPELIVVDLGLPNRAGFDLVEGLAARKKSNVGTKKLAIVALTNRSLSAEERSLLAKSADLVAEKGVMTGAGFLDSIAALLEQSAPRKKARILVVDDSAINRSVLRAMLESAGFEVVEADRAKDGIA
ncbi:MAG: ATP-binding protein, partial [Polyangiaceae bacterium]